jgi:hypothetical protein
MVNKATPPADVLSQWNPVLIDATRDWKLKEEAAARAEDVFRICVRDCFDAGMTVNEIAEAIKEAGVEMGPSRIYQIKRGVRR